MNVLNKLASTMGRRDEVPNQKLAEEITVRENHKAIEELFYLIDQHEDRKVHHDCIKVLYEIGERKPALISKHIKRFIDLLANKNNRLVWGAMTALDTITKEVPDQVYANLPKILRAMKEGSVITKDHGIGILIKLSCLNKYKAEVSHLLFEQLMICIPKQLPMYAERSFIAIDKTNQEDFVKILDTRLTELEKDSQIKRVEKVIKKLIV
ncbi:hypothetical protein QQ008_16810 [Fulvivirgaceae bacterium BMA10]|uniref:HEAT repeat domain-containing protein n=1 Tax=Splendidivirga corallicola TaxID=3051826 RepID=A0ABT8KQM2_9BACT|nr:hypothetical protein [Fulvivirgaceae bacterium BMA10]